jgi:hypothetical protein
MGGRGGRWRMEPRKEGRQGREKQGKGVRSGRGEWRPQEKEGERAKGETGRRQRPSWGTPSHQRQGHRKRGEIGKKEEGSRGKKGTDGSGECEVRKQREQGMKEQAVRVAQEEKEVEERSGVDTQQGKRQRERELERAGGRQWGGERAGGRGWMPSRSYLLCHLSHRLDAGPVEVAVVLASLNELVCLNVLLHFLPG